uniref:Uncharacterized protein n=1 Tax=Naja naja TaxID=35670 RepID=A0A8C6X9V1_NAJNA
MDVSETLEQNPRSPSEKDEEEDDHQPSDDEILKGSSSEQDGEEGQGLPSEEEERLSETKSPDSDRNDQSQPLKSSLRAEQAEDGANDLGDEASSVIRELDEHELDYDEEVPEEPSTWNGLSFHRHPAWQVSLVWIGKGWPKSPVDTQITSEAAKQQLCSAQEKRGRILEVGRDKEAKCR